MSIDTGNYLFLAGRPLTSKKTLGGSVSRSARISKKMTTPKTDPLKKIGGIAGRSDHSSIQLLRKLVAVSRRVGEGSRRDLVSGAAPRSSRGVRAQARRVAPEVAAACDQPPGV